MNEPEQYMTRVELAERLCISQRHLINCEQAGLPCFRIGSSVRYRLSEVTGFLEQNRTLQLTVKRRMASKGRKALDDPRTTSTDQDDSSQASS